MRVRGLDHLVLTVRDPDATVAFYEALGMVAESFDAADGTRRLALRFGDQKINLHVAGREFEPRARAAMPGSADLCFLVDSLDGWAERLSAMGVALELGPVVRSGATGSIRSIYLRDPDGNLVELAIPLR